MNLGIERELVGDIIIKVPDAYVYCLSHIADYICDNLDSIKHTHIRCTICTDEIEAIKPELAEMLANEEWKEIHTGEVVDAPAVIPMLSMNLKSLRLRSLRV